MATHSSIHAQRNPWTEEPGRLHFMGLQRVGYDRAISLLSKGTEFLEDKINIQIIMILCETIVGIVIGIRGE